MVNIFDNIVAQYKLNETTGTTAFDNSGNEYHGAIYDADDNAENASVVTETHDSLASMNKYFNMESTIDHYIEVGDYNDFSFTNGSGSDTPFSISCWFRVTSLTGTQLFVSKYDSLADDYEWILYHNSGTLYFRANHPSDSGIYNGVSKSGSISINTWYHLVFTYDGDKTDSSGMKMYLDGDDISVSDFSAGSYEGMSNTDAKVYISAYKDNVPVSHLKGCIDNVCIFDKELSQEEVGFLYNTGDGTEKLFESFSSGVNFGFITDVHYTAEYYAEFYGFQYAPGGGAHARRLITSRFCFQEAALHFKDLDEQYGLDFWFSGGDELNYSMGTGATADAEYILQEYITDSKQAGDIPFYMTQGHHTQRHFDKTFSALATYTWNNYYNILFNPVTGNGGPVENGFPGDAGYPYTQTWDGVSGTHNWPLSYTFTKNGIKFIVYTRYYGGTDDIETFYSSDHKGWLRDQLDVDMPVVVFSHCHIWEDDDKPAISGAFYITDWDISNPHWDGTPEEDTIKYILENSQANILAVFGGHWHDGNRNMELNGIKYFSMPGSIKTSVTPYEHINGNNNGSLVGRVPVRNDAESENAYFFIEIGSDLEVKITGYGYNAQKQTTNNFDNYSTEMTRYNLVDGSETGIVYSKRFSLIDNNVLDITFGTAVTYFIDSNATIIIDGESYIVGSDISGFEPSGVHESADSIGTFIWDKGGEHEYEFQSVGGFEGEFTSFTHPNGKTIRITWEGKGSHQFLVEIISGETTSTDIDAHPIIYYKAKSGDSDLESDTWYINQNKKHAFKIFSDYDPIEDV